MRLDYKNWSRRIDLALRARYPYFETRIYKISEHNYLIYIKNDIDDFASLSKEFNNSIRYVTAPVKIVNKVPEHFEEEIPNIPDDDIPSKFQGLPFTVYQLSNHIECIHPDLEVTRVIENFNEGKITIELKGSINDETKIRAKNTLKELEGPFSFELIDKGIKKEVKAPDNMVFEIASSSSQKRLKAKFLERDEELWFDKIEEIYKSNFTKDDLFYYDSSKTKCLVDFSKFLNSNIRNHLLLYDTVFCSLPLRENMSSFLEP